MTKKRREKKKKEVLTLTMISDKYPHNHYILVLGRKATRIELCSEDLVEFDEVRKKQIEKERGTVGGANDQPKDRDQMGRDERSAAVKARIGLTK
jgi:hypothetical protein